MYLIAHNVKPDFLGVKNWGWTFESSFEGTSLWYFYTLPSSEMRAAIVTTKKYSEAF